MKEPNTMEASRTTKDVYRRMQEASKKNDYDYQYEAPTPHRNLWERFTNFLYVKEKEIVVFSFGLVLSVISIGALKFGPFILKHI